MSSISTTLLETIRKRENEKVVAAALNEVLKQCSGQYLNNNSANAVLEAVAKVLLEGVKSDNKFEKLKDAGNVVSAIRVLSLAGKDALPGFPKALGSEFSILLMDNFNVKFACLELYSISRVSWTGSYEVFVWLKSALAPAILAVCKMVANGSSPQQHSEGFGRVCAQALAMLVADLSLYDAQVLLSDLNVPAFAVALLQSSALAPNQESKQAICAALANVIVTWRKVCTLPESVIFGAEEEFIKLVIATISMDHQTLPELMLLSNLCYNSRRTARLIVKLGGHQSAISILQATKGKNTAITRSCCTFLSNLARKQVKLHQHLIEKNIAAGLKDALSASPDTIVVISILGCILNMTSSASGRCEMLQFESTIVYELFPRYKGKPEVIELCLGVLWGLCVRANAKTPDKQYEWLQTVLQSMQYTSSHPGCVRRGIGALIISIATLPETKKVLSERFKNFLGDVSAVVSKHKANVGIVNDATILGMLLTQ